MTEIAADPDFVRALEQQAGPTPAPKPAAPIIAPGDAASALDALVAEASAADAGYPTTPSSYADIAKGAGMGLAHGAIGLAGLPGDVSSGLDKAISWVALKGAEKLGLLPPGKTADDAIKAGQDAAARMNAVPASNGSGITMPAELSLPFAGSAQIKRGIEKLAGPFPEPKTPEGQVAENVTSFFPAAVAGPGNVGRNLVAYGVAPAIGSELAGRAANAYLGPDAEKYGRAAGAVLGAITGHGIAGAQPVDTMLSGATRGVTDAEIAAARAIQGRAAQQGITLTGAEALGHATGGKGNLTNIQRVLEGANDSAPVMQNFFADRPAQVETAGRRAFDTIAPATNQPSVLGAQAQQAGQGVLDTIEGHINTATRPYYRAAENHVINSSDFAPIAADPAFQESLRRLRADPVLGPQYAGMPDSSVGVVDAVTKDMRAQGQALGNAVNPGFQPQKSGMFGSGATTARDIARDPARGGSADYDTALAMQEQARGQFLAPREAGPIGKIAGTPDTATQGAVLYPGNPQPGSQFETAQAIGDLERQHPGLAGQLTRQHLERGFNEATQANVSGPNQFGGAKFAATMMGNPQQAQNVRAGLAALPNQPTIDPLVEALMATGQRQPIGSRTSFNTQMLAGPLSEGKPLGSLASLAAAPEKALAAARDWYQKYRMGSNTETMARALIDPNFFDRLTAARSAVPPDQYRSLLVQQLMGRRALTPPIAPAIAQSAGQHDQPR